MPSNRKLRVYHEAMQAFDNGNSEKFWQNWHQIAKDQSRLEFHAHLHFTVYPIKHNLDQSKIDEAKTFFRQFLETSGKQLSQTTEFLQYYALPFIDHPESNPNFKDLFNDSYISETRSKIDSYLAERSKEIFSKPKLEEILENSQATSAEELKVVQKKLEKAESVAKIAERKCTSYMKRCTTLQKDYHNLINIAAELVDTLEQCVYGNQVSAEYLAGICKRLFSSESTLNNSIGDVNISKIVSRPGTASSFLRSSINNAKNETLNSLNASKMKLPESKMASQSPTPRVNTPMNRLKTPRLGTAQSRPKSATLTKGSVPSLDYALIFDILENSNDAEKILKVLQGLRWRITQSSNPSERIEVVKQYIGANILAVSQNRFDTRIHKRIPEFHARLYNTVASIAHGRNFLGENQANALYFLSLLKNRTGNNYREYFKKEIYLHRRSSENENTPCI